MIQKPTLPAAQSPPAGHTHRHLVRKSMNTKHYPPSECGMAMDRQPQKIPLPITGRKPIKFDWADNPKLGR